MLLSRRKLLQAGAAACAAPLLGCGSLPAAGSAPPLRLLGHGTLLHRLQFQGTTVGGLSALDFDAGSGTFIALSDDRSELQPARFYTLRLDVADAALRVELLSVVTLRQANGQPYPPRRLGGEVVDPEGLRLLPGGAGLLWTSEGDPRLGLQPSLHQARRDGVLLRTFETPPMLRFPGPRTNHTFEGLALSPDARTAWVAMEGALQQDGPMPKVGVPGAPCRITAFDVAAGRAVRQLAYLPDAIPHEPLIPGGMAENGISEILMIDARRMLVLERAYSIGIGTSLRLYEIDTSAATDTLAMPKLEPGAFRPAAKRLVADFAHLGLLRTDNTEGMTWGPPLPNGRRTLVVVSDDNFNPLQVTQFAAFEYLDET
ncbi:MAG: esterase-like activity of phytase family protein [Ramlibacter sp.]